MIKVSTSAAIGSVHHYSAEVQGKIDLSLPLTMLNFTGILLLLLFVGQFFSCSSIPVSKFIGYKSKLTYTGMHVTIFFDFAELGLL